ncbi:MAG: biotin/lipoyl-containing protein [Bacteroidota bacterium]
MIFHSFTSVVSIPYYTYANEKAGEDFKQHKPLFVIEAMKMESIVTASKVGIVTTIALSEATMVEQDDLVLTIGN